MTYHEGVITLLICVVFLMGVCAFIGLYVAMTMGAVQDILAPSQVEVVPNKVNPDDLTIVSPVDE